MPRPRGESVAGCVGRLGDPIGEGAVGVAACSWASLCLVRSCVNSLALLISCRPSLMVRCRAVTWIAVPTQVCIPLRAWQYRMESSKLIPRPFERPGAKITHSVGLVMMTVCCWPMVALKKSFSSPSFQAYACSGFWSRAVTTRTETQYCSRRRAPSETETAECVARGVSPFTSVESSRAALPAHPVAPRRDIRGSCLGVSPGVALDPPDIIDTWHLFRRSTNCKSGRFVLDTAGEVVASWPRGQ